LIESEEAEVVEGTKKLEVLNDFITELEAVMAKETRTTLKMRRKRCEVEKKNETGLAGKHWNRSSLYDSISNSGFRYLE
jgi:hypothetical protein